MMHHKAKNQLTEKETRQTDLWQEFLFQEKLKNTNLTMTTSCLLVPHTQRTSLIQSFLDILQESSKLTVRLRELLNKTSSIRTIQATSVVHNSMWSTRCPIKNASGLNQNSIAHKVQPFGLHHRLEKFQFWQKQTTTKNAKVTMPSK